MKRIEAIIVAACILAVIGLSALSFLSIKFALVAALGLAAIISDVATAKASTSAWIDSQNPKRLNVETTVQLSGNTNIVSVNLNFGFYFGAAQLVA